MQRQRPTDINNFFSIGINYRKTDASLRGKFAIGQEQYALLLANAAQYDVTEFFVLSTCNRTEIYGFAEKATQLMDLLCTQTEGSLDVFNSMAYKKKGNAAIEHLFNVAAGLDSQILGDYEIIGQLKQAAKFAKAHHCIGTYLERILNAALQSSKVIKNSTSLSGGTVSVSFAAIQYIKEKITKIADKKILLLGVGKIGSNTCKNMVDYLNTKNITLINRTEGKAKELAEELGLQFASTDELAQQIDESDIIVVATNSIKPVVLKEHLKNGKKKLLIDLSIPYNVEESSRELPHITLLNVDELSKIKDETLQKRMTCVPQAKAIIQSHIADFIDWHQMRKNVPVLQAVKSKLKQMHLSDTICCTTVQPEQRIQKIIDGMAVKMRQQTTYGCQYIEAINDFISPVAN